MPLPFESKSSSSKNQDGVYVQEVKIRSVKACYGEKPWKGALYSDDIGLQMELDVGRDFYPNFYVGGNWKKEQGVSSGFGSSLKVKILLQNLGFNNIDNLFNEDCTLPDSVIQEMVNRSFLRLSYCKGYKDNGDISWKDWQETGSVESGEFQLKVKFHESVEGDYVKDYEKPAELPVRADTGYNETKFAL
jgi:hypothetical protein